MKQIGDQMAAAAGYTSQYSFQLYDTSGTTEDWNYAAAGSYGYTIEMGPVGGQFHMPYEKGVVDEWRGKPGTPAEGKGLREALPTVPRGGAFTWHVTPSTWPFVGAKYVAGEKVPTGEPLTFAAKAGENKLAEGALDEEGGSVEREFTVDREADEIVVDLRWAATPQDYDLKLFQVQADGTRKEVGNSGNAPGSFEKITLADPAQGTYVLRVIYYATAANDWTAKVTFLDRQADRVEPTGKTEAWTLTCETRAATSRRRGR